MGNPLTLSSSMTLGIVGNPSRVFTSFTGSDMDDMDLGDGQVTGLFTRWIQHDALILPGNSGGPLVNLRGEVVGINELGGNGVGFAIPSNLAAHVLNQALTYGEVRRGWFGVTIFPVEKMDLKHGALVSALQPGGPAEQAGVVPGDVLLSIDGAADRRRLLRGRPGPLQADGRLRRRHEGQGRRAPRRGRQGGGEVLRRRRHEDGEVPRRRARDQADRPLRPRDHRRPWPCSAAGPTRTACS